jgi:hypothetical protein
MFVLTLQDGVCCGWFIHAILCWCRCPEIGRLALSTGPNWVGSTWRRRQNPVSETLCVLIRTGRWIISRNTIIVNTLVTAADVNCNCELLFVKKGKSISVTVCGGPQGCETSSLPHFLDNRLTDCDEVVSLTRRQPFTFRNIPGSHFC